MIRRHYTFSYPFPPSEVVEFFRLYYGPINRRLLPSTPSAVRIFAGNSKRSGFITIEQGRDCTTVFAEYLEVFGVRA